MLLIIGVILVVVGVSDFGAAGVIHSSQASADPSGLGAREPTSVVRLLRLMGVGTIVVGVVLIVVALVS